MKVRHLPCRCTAIPEIVPSSFKAILRCKSLTPGVSVACLKPKRNKALNCGALGKKRCNTILWCFPHKSEANLKSVAQTTCISYQKAAQEQCTIFTNCCILFDVYRTYMYLYTPFSWSYYIYIYTHLLGGTHVPCGFAG